MAASLPEQGQKAPVNPSTDDTVAWLETLRLMSEELGPHSPFQASLSVLLGMIARRHGFLRPHIILFEPETGLLRLSLAETPPQDTQANYSPGVGVTGQVFSTGAPVVVEHMGNHPLFQNRIFQRTPEEMNTLSFLSVPILAPSARESEEPPEVIGTLNADIPFYSPRDLQIRCTFLQAMAALIANEAGYMQEEMGRQRRLTGAVAHTDEKQEAFRMVAQSKVMRHILEQAAHLAQGRVPLLLRGETGVGKGRLARWIHSVSPRRDMPLLVYHCGASAPEQQEADLRGYIKGTFPGAVQNYAGPFEQARAGTIFLDAVEALSPRAQEALITLLRDNTVQKIGASTYTTVDVRVIVAAGSGLEEALAAGAFSRELFTRISHHSLSIPALRDRKEDIIPLAEDALQTIASQSANAVKRISYPALELLTRYSWPGNVPELKRAMAQAALSSDEDSIRATDLPSFLQTTGHLPTHQNISLPEAVARLEKELLMAALANAEGNMLQAARDLQCSYRMVNYKVKKYGIEPQKFLTSSKSS